jgi:hypothetical protein
MTDAESRTLTAYLTNVLEPMLKLSETGYTEEDTTVNSPTTHSLDRDIALRMRSYHLGSCDSLRSAIADFKELFAEELTTTKED